MLPKRNHEIEGDVLPRVTLTADGHDATDRRAFAAGTELRIYAELPRRMGVANVVMRLCGPCR